MKIGEPPLDSWELYKITKFFFATDDILKARKRIKLAEVTSDVQSDVEDVQKRCPKRTKPFISDSDSECDDWRKSQLPRPKVPKINLANLNGSQKTLPTPSSPIASDATTITVVSSCESLQNTPTASSAQSNITGSSGFSKHIVDLLSSIKEQNVQILNLLNKFDRRETNSQRTYPENFPITLPVQDINNLDVLEEYLSDKANSSAIGSYLSTLGGKEVVSKTNTILKKCLSNKIASFFNFYGKRNQKKAFSELNLCKIIIDSVKRVSPEGTEKEVEDCIKCWLKHAPQRLNMESKSKQAHTK